MWRARSTGDGKTISIGTFVSEFEAAKAYGTFIAALNPACGRLVKP
jgi:hypothetical protein